MATRRAIPAEMYELAAMEGAGRWQTLRRVTLPLLGPTLSCCCCATRSTRSRRASCRPSSSPTAGPPEYATTFLPLFIYRNGFEYLRFGYAAAATVVMLVRHRGPDRRRSTSSCADGASPEWRERNDVPMPYPVSRSRLWKAS